MDGLKFAIVVVTLFQFLATVTTLALVTFLIININHHQTNVDPTGLYITLGVSIVFVVVSFLGLCGATLENSTLLRAFAGINFLFLFLVIIAIITVSGILITILFKMKNGLDNSNYEPDKWISEIFEKIFNLVDKNGRYKTHKMFLDKFQQAFNCCGIYPVKDGQSIPNSHSCCVEGPSCDKERAFKQPCISYFYLGLMGTLAIGLLFIAFIIPTLLLITGSWSWATSRKKIISFPSMNSLELRYMR